MMRREKSSKELDETIRLLVRLVESEGAKLVHDERIRSALRELKKSRKGGQILAARVVRAVALISAVACDVLIDHSSDDSNSDEQ